VSLNIALFYSDSISIIYLYKENFFILYVPRDLPETVQIKKCYIQGYSNKKLQTKCYKHKVKMRHKKQQTPLKTKT